MKRISDNKQFFPIGDFHIENLEQSRIFADYLNQRPESLMVLLGDIVHFANSIWNPAVQVEGQSEVIRHIEEDIVIWESFVSRLRVQTIYYFGTHETCALHFIRKYLPSRKVKIVSKFVAVPKNLMTIKIDESNKHSLGITGLHVPGNVYPTTSERFVPKKKMVEKWIEDKVRGIDFPNPRDTILCTHDPCDVHYRNMGYQALTRTLEKWPFKVHYHAHIHSNIHDRIVNKTETVNRSFAALSRFKKEALEPSTSEIRSLYAGDI